MSKTNDEAPVAAPEHITLDEFCMRLSMSDRRVELIGGFAYSEKAAGRIKDAESEFQTRYSAFANKSV